MFPTVPGAESFTLLLCAEVVVVATTAAVSELDTASGQGVVPPAWNVGQAVTRLLRHRTHLCNQAQYSITTKSTYKELIGTMKNCSL